MINIDLKHLNQKRKATFWCLLILGVTLISTSLMATHIDKLAINWLTDMLNHGLPFDQIKGTVNEFVGGEVIRVIPFWLSILGTLTGFLCVYVAAHLALCKTYKLKEILTEKYWTTFTKTFMYRGKGK